MGAALEITATAHTAAELRLIASRCRDALNPMENVWEYLRANKLCALVWDGYDAIVAACKTAWDFLIQDPDRIRSIGHRDWACVKA